VNVAAMGWKTVVLIVTWMILFVVVGVFLGRATRDAPPPAPMPSQVGATEDL
jgi:hypothetical protein